VLQNLLAHGYVHHGTLGWHPLVRLGRIRHYVYGYAKCDCNDELRLASSDHIHDLRHHSGYGHVSHPRLWQVNPRRHHHGHRIFRPRHPHLVRMRIRNGYGGAWTLGRSYCGRRLQHHHVQHYRQLYQLEGSYKVY